MDIIQNFFTPIHTDYENAEVEENLGMFALYSNREDADNTIAKLELNGIKRSDISLLAPQRSGHHAFIHDQKYSLAKGAAIGALTGAIISGVLGFFFGTHGHLFTPSGFTSFSPSFTPITIAVAIAIGLIYGAAAGVLVGIGSPKSAAKRYGFYLMEGGIVLVVHIRKDTDQLLLSRILENSRGQDIQILDQSKIWSTIIPEKNRLVYAH